MGELHARRLPRGYMKGKRRQINMYLTAEEWARLIPYAEKYTLASIGITALNEWMDRQEAKREAGGDG